MHPGVGSETMGSGARISFTDCARSPDLSGFFTTVSYCSQHILLFSFSSFLCRSCSLIRRTLLLPASPLRTQTHNPPAKRKSGLCEEACRHGETLTNAQRSQRPTAAASARGGPGGGSAARAGMPCSARLYRPGSDPDARQHLRVRDKFARDSSQSILRRRRDLVHGSVDGSAVV